MKESWLTSFDINKNTNLKLLYIANGAPQSNNYEKLSNGIVTEYHNEIYSILKELGVKMISSNSLNDIISKSSNFNYVFTLLNRLNFDNSEVFVSTFCEYLGVKYLGAKPNIRALAEDKHLTKILSKFLEIPTSPWMLFRIGESISEPEFDGPYFVKWRFGASSLDVDTESCANDWNSVKNRIQYLHAQKKDVIVEKLLKGISITVPVLLANTPQVLPPVITNSPKPYGIVTHQQARMLENGLVREILSEKSFIQQTKEFSEKIFDAVRPIDYLRVDYKVDDFGIPNLLEFNVCCNISSRSAICLSGNSIGISQKEIVSHILNQSLLRQGF